MWNSEQPEMLPRTEKKTRYSPEILTARYPQNGNTVIRKNWVTKIPRPHHFRKNPFFKNFGKIASTRKFVQVSSWDFLNPWGRPVGHGSCDWSGVASPQPQGSWLVGGWFPQPGNGIHVTMAKWKLYFTQKNCGCPETSATFFGGYLVKTRANLTKCINDAARKGFCWTILTICL